jgi:hypothetical protein
MTAVAVPIEQPAPPKLLLDANVFRDLADGTLAQLEQRLLHVAAHRSPPLLWTCPIVFDEIVCHVRAEEAERFEHFRDALRWMDRLCGNAGMAEDLGWVLRRAVFARAVLYDGELSTVLNKFRRRLIKLGRFADVPEDLLEAVSGLRVESRERIDAWATRHRQIQSFARAEPKPGERRIEGKVATSNAFFEISRKHAAADMPVWGPFRPEAEQRAEQREMAAFELAHLLKARSREGYNVEKHEGDYNDGWLLAYPSVGYRLITGDVRLRRALEMAGCTNPRVSDVGEAVDIAESWLTSSRAAPEI